MLHALDRLAPHVPPGTPFVVITGAAPRGDCQSVYRTMLDVLPRLADRAAALGVRIAFEPLNPILFHTDTALWGLDAGLELVTDIGHPQLGLCLDTWNVFQTPNLDDVIGRAAGKIFLVQVSDWRRPRANADRRNLGEGEIPNANIVEAVRAAGYGGPFVLEIFSEESLPDSLWRGDIRRNLERNVRAFAALAARVAL
jgi:sugar phosphate isomerase/epimerase